MPTTKAINLPVSGVIECESVADQSGLGHTLFDDRFADLPMDQSIGTEIDYLRTV